MPRPLSTALLACLILGLSCCNIGNLQGTGGPFTTTMYAATSAGLSVSQNGGSSWVTMGFAGNAVNSVAAITSGSYVTVYAATNSGLFVTSDGGTTWTPTGLIGTQVNGVYISGTDIYAATTGGVAIYNGTIWTPVSFATLADPLDTAATGIYAVGTSVYASTNAGLSISSDGGTTWTQATGLPSNNILAVFDDGINVYAATADQGLAVASNASPTTWTTYNTSNGLPSNVVQGVYASGGSIFAATAAGLSVFNGSIWTTHLGGISVNSVFVSGTSVYAATAQGVWVSLDSGTTWNDYTTSQGLSSNVVKSMIVQ